jgi:hypothetical protein
MTFTMVVSTAGGGGTLTDRWALGDFYGPQSFPFNSLIQDATVTINNSSVSLSQRDMFYPLQKTLPMEDFQELQAGCPCMADRYAAVADQAASVNGEAKPYTDCDNNQKLLPRGAFRLISMAETANSMVDASGGGPFAQTYTFVIETEEPLFVSPLLVSGKSNSRGMYGVNNISINLSLDATASRAWYFGQFVANNNPNSNATSATTLTSLALTSISNDCFLLVNQLSTQPSQLLPSRCVLPHVERRRFITTGGALNAAASTQFQMNNIQLNQIPSKIYCFVRQTMSSQTVSNLNHFFSINSATLTFNNQSGILANAQPIDLWRMSAAAGYQGSFSEWSGSATRRFNRATVGAVATADITVPLSGSLLIIEPYKNLNLSPFLTESSIGQYNLEVSLNVTNQTTGNIAAIEGVVMVENAGIFTIVAGSSSVTSGLYDMSIVEKVSQQSPQADSEVSPCKVGKGMSDKIASALKSHPLVKKHLEGEGARSGGGVSSGGRARSGGASKLDSLIF